jgi:hypothetical protein
MQTDPKTIAAQLSDEVKRKVLRARHRGGDDYVMQRGDSRGLHGVGLVARSIDHHYLTRLGVSVRRKLEKSK